jgi:hypothetical protein
LTLPRVGVETPRRLGRSEVVRAAEVELFMLTEDGSRAPRGDQASSTAEPSHRTVPPQARAGQLHAPAQQSASGHTADAALDRAGAPDPDATLAELGPSAEPGSSSDSAFDGGRGVRPRVNLGIDGSVMRQAALEARERGPGASRAPRRRPVFSLGHWSEKAVRSVAQRSAPWEGRALLTLEWDAKGQLLSVTASSSSDEWQRLAKALSSQLAARPNVGEQGGGRRVVYLVKSDLMLPESKRSVLPAAKFASAEQLRADNLPPAPTINLGVKPMAARQRRAWSR